MAARRPFWKWHCWKSIGFCLWPPSTCIWNLKLKCQSRLELCSGNHVVYRQTDGRTDGRTDGQTDRRTDKVNPVYPPPTSLGGGITIYHLQKIWLKIVSGNGLLPIQHDVFTQTSAGQYSWCQRAKVWLLYFKETYLATIGPHIL